MDAAERSRTRPWLRASSQGAVVGVAIGLGVLGAQQFPRLLHTMDGFLVIVVAMTLIALTPVTAALIGLAAAAALRLPRPWVFALAGIPAGIAAMAAWLHCPWRLLLVGGMVILVAMAAIYAGLAILATRSLAPRGAWFSLGTILALSTAFILGLDQLPNIP